MSNSLGRDMAIGVAGSIGILAFGIPVLAPLALIAAGITHAAVNSRREDKDDDCLPEQDDNSSSRPEPYRFRMPEIVHPSRESYVMPNRDLPLWNSAARFPTVNNRSEILMPLRNNAWADSVEEDEDDKSNRGSNEPSPRNELYFARHRRRM